MTVSFFKEGAREVDDGAREVDEGAREVDEGAREIDEGQGRSMRGSGRSMRVPGRSMREPERSRWGRGREGQGSFFIFKPNRTKTYPILQYFILWFLTNIYTINHSLNSSAY